MVCSNLDYAKTTRELETLPSFEARLKRVAELISGQTKYPTDVVEVTALTFYKKLLAAHNYKSTSKIVSNVTLIKPTENYAKLAADYGLSEVCTSKIDIVTVKGDHRTILTGDSVEKIATVLEALTV